MFEKGSNIKFHQNPSNGSRTVPCGRTNKRTGLDSSRELQEFETPRIVRLSAHEDDKACNHIPPLPHKRKITNTSVRGGVEPRTMVRPKELSQ